MKFLPVKTAWGKMSFHHQSQESVLWLTVFFRGAVGNSRLDDEPQKGTLALLTDRLQRRREECLLDSLLWSTLASLSISGSFQTCKHIKHHHGNPGIDIGI